MLRIWLRERLRLRRADIRTRRSTRMASTLPFRVLAAPRASPDWAARAAVMASWGSDLPRLRRRWRFGRSTSTTAMPSREKMSRQAGPIGAGALDADQLDVPEGPQPA